MKNTISEHEMLEMIKDWLLKKRTNEAFVRRTMCSKKEIIDGLVEAVDYEIAQLPKELKATNDGDLVGKGVRIICCNAYHHVPGENSCVHPFIGQTVEITAYIGRGLYRIKETGRVIARSEFELLPEQPAEVSAQTEHNEQFPGLGELASAQRCCSSIPAGVPSASIEKPWTF